MADNDLLPRARSLLASIDADAPLPAIARRHNLDEAWFSDHLAWLLDPEADHGLGTRAAEGFLRLLARIRTRGHADEGHHYNHRGQFLRWGRAAVRGTPATGLDLHNAAVFREFYLARASSSGRATVGAFCDVVLIDLDRHDGLVVAIENKLFTTNARGQLERYHDVLEERYRRARILEYAYLTLLGDPPLHATTSGSRRSDRTWIRLSWVRDLLPLLENLDSSHTVPGARDLLRVLRWFAAASDGRRLEETAAVVTALFEALVSATTDALVAELGRLGDGAPGDWIVRRRSRLRTRIVHTSKPTVPLLVGVLPNLSLVLYTRRRDRRKYDKLLIPFGSNADQIGNLLGLVARDVYPLHFGAGHRRYLGPAARRRAADIAGDGQELFRFMHAHRHELRLLVGLGRVGVGGDLVGLPVVSS